MKPCFKPFDRPEGEDVWYCHPSNLSSEKQVYYKALSQVPDLNNGKDCSHFRQDQDKKYVKGSIHTSDTAYIRLAKAGGRKDLLSFVENYERSKSPQGYPVPSWYGHSEEDRKDDEVTLRVKYPKRPDWMTVESPTMDVARQKDAKYTPDQDIIAWDKMSSWKRDDFDRQMQQKAKNTYEKRKKKQPKSVQLKTKVNKDERKDGRRLPDISKSQFQGFRKLSGTELATQWYKKWYLIGNA